jgi:Aldo/keto reductase family
MKGLPNIQLSRRYRRNRPCAPRFSLPKGLDMSPSDKIVLNKGNSIPRLGLGVYQSGRGRASENAVTWALEAGYRHVDTAAMYGNEMEVGAALKRAFATGLVRREKVFVTTKLWNSDHGYDEALPYELPPTRIGPDRPFPPPLALA